MLIFIDTSPSVCGHMTRSITINSPRLFVFRKSREPFRRGYRSARLFSILTLARKFSHSVRSVGAKCANLGIRLWIQVICTRSANWTHQFSFFFSRTNDEYSKISHWRSFLCRSNLRLANELTARRSETNLPHLFVFFFILVDMGMLF